MSLGGRIHPRAVTRGLARCPILGLRLSHVLDRLVRTARGGPDRRARRGSGHRACGRAVAPVAVAFASTSVIVGVIWDISWHRSIGRDSFWTPAHMAIYLGGVVAGLSCGWLVLHTTFAGSARERAAAVSF